MSKPIVESAFFKFTLYGAVDNLLIKSVKTIKTKLLFLNVTVLCVNNLVKVYAIH